MTRAKLEELTEFYRGSWKGQLDESESEALLEKASDVIDNAIYLSGYSVETVPELLKIPVYKAICAEADYINECGGLTAMETGGSYSLGQFSYTEGSTSTSGTAFGLCQMSVGYLNPTGLLYKGVRVL